MGSSLSVRMSGQFQATLQATVGIQSPTNSYLQPVNLSLNPGTGDGLADQIWSDQRDLAPNGGFTFDLATFNGAKDITGNGYSLAKLKFIGVWNNTGTETATLIAGGAPAGSRGWTGISNGTISLNGTSAFMAFDPGPQGYSVPAGNGNNLFKVANAGSLTANYTVVVVGATG